MKALKNNLDRHLSFSEQEAVIKSVEAIEEAFRRRIYSVTINPVTGDAATPFGVMFSFDRDEK